MSAYSRYRFSVLIPLYTGARNRQMVADMKVADVIADYTQPASITGADSVLYQFAPYDTVYDTVSSPDVGDDLGGTPYDVALRPYLNTQSGMLVAINGSPWRWIRAFLGWQEPGYRLLFFRRSRQQLEYVRNIKMVVLFKM